ncbi:MAG TPA: HEAT repeat domain-containing protein [Bryobacteraceae bacterium]|jgi:hypothetical protein|nr:HEAT repeat domain-containing protein [Bryobacteraceae bacterium]
MKLSGSLLIASLLFEASAMAQDPARIAREARDASRDAAREASKISGDVGYSAGTRALDSRQYETAIRSFDKVIAAKSDRADGALYWKAYALNRLGRTDDALAAIASLRRDFPGSRWLNDAQALEVEAKQRAGKPVSPGDESNEDLKLMAINGLMNADPSRAIPLLDGVLKGAGSPRLKDRAIFVLTQSSSPEARRLLADYAKGGANPDLQLRAIRYLGMAGTADTKQQLKDIFRASTDAPVKAEILRSLAVSGGGADILDMTKDEKNPKLRSEAIRDAAVIANVPTDSLLKLYASETDSSVKKEIVSDLFIRHGAKELVELARKESDPAMKKTIVERLSLMRESKEATDYMMELLK